MTQIMQTQNARRALQEMRSTANKFVWLEGVRGALALLVCAGHLGLNTVLNKVGLHVWFGLSVDIFFVMSGFVLSHAYFFSNRSFTQFVVGRIARLYPLHVATLASSYVAAKYWIAGDLVVVLQNVFLVQNIGLPPNMSGHNFPSWSISVEFWIGIAFFLLMRSAQASKLLSVVIALLPLTLVLPDYVASQEQNYGGIINGGVLRGLFGFAVGVSAFMTFRTFNFRNYSLCAAVASLTVLAILFTEKSTIPASALLLYATAFILIISLSCLPCDNKFVVASCIFLGSISYSVYLLHIPVYMIMVRLLGEDSVRSTGKVWVFLAIAIIAPFSAYLFERPAQRWLLRTLPVR